VEPQCPLATETLGNCTYLIGDECFPKTFNETVCSQCDPHILCKFDEFTKPEGLIYWLQWFNLFGFYWAMNFVTSYGEMVLAGVFAKWYWTRDKSMIPCSTLCTSIFNATVYHLGTIAFGSLIIAIIKVLSLKC
jgi:choline transporter-like protein 2/4/5